jgi:hypothetical protein
VSFVDETAGHIVEILKAEKVRSVAKIGKYVSGSPDAHTVLFGLGR